MLLGAGGASRAIDFVRPVLERRDEASERLVEHRAHQEPEREALELVVDVELDLAPRRIGAKRPAVLEEAEGAVDVFDEDAKPGPVERHPRSEGLLDLLVADP